MGVKNLPQIASSLIAHGKDPATPVAIIEEGLRMTQRVTIGTLRDIGRIAGERGVKPPAVIVIGGVVSLYREGEHLIPL
jgi:uroporphyrin-III C-methyltransferase